MDLRAQKEFVKRLINSWMAPRSRHAPSKSRLFRPSIQRLEDRLAMSAISLVPPPTSAPASLTGTALVSTPSVTALASTTSSITGASCTGEGVTITVQVSGSSPTGTVQVDFYDNTGVNLLATASGTLNGSGIANVTQAIIPEIYFIQARYLGDANNGQSSSAFRAIDFEVDCPDDFGIILLNKTGRSLQVDGNAVIDLGDGKMAVDSSDAKAAFISSNGVVKAGEVDIHGGDFLPGHGLIDSPAVNLGAPVVADPFAALGVPAMGTLRSSSKLSITSGNVTLQPGRYIGGIDIKGTANVTLMPGTYYMDGGGFSISGQANVTDNGSGVMIYNAAKKNSDTISVTGQGVVTLTGLRDGSAFQGLVFYQVRSSTNTIQLDGLGFTNLAGTIYGANALVKVNGQGDKLIRTGQIVAGQMMVTGNGRIRVAAGHANCTCSVTFIE